MELFSVKQIIALLLYGIVSIILVVLNKRILTGDFGYPLITTWIQQICGLICYVFAYLLTSSLIPKYNVFSKPGFNLKYIKVCLPMSISCIAFISLSNTCLKYVPVSSYAIARSLTLLFNVIFSVLLLKQSISKICIIACLIVMTGFTIGSYDSQALNIYGIMTGALSSIFQSIYIVQIKKVTPALNNAEFLTYWYNVLITSFFAFIFIYIFSENKAFNELLLMSPFQIINTICPIVLSGILNFIFGLITYWCIQVTSPIAYNLTGYVKSGLQSLIGVITNGETLSFITLLSLSMTIGGSAMYTFARLSENDQKQDHIIKNSTSFKKLFSEEITPINDSCKINNGNPNECLVNPKNIK
ncbi:hypothetical protein cand_022150 [Cryptosporidium andersoni]|uniref:Sugar phosphate transporter domain-containing protein n=1 Tax=Cryptosporidium andersoni TaxID=117008 RepID=A0A1J4MSJ6_9CRYT|nr:hypothetical protein cand_022150 [Cryptosporidium andersoni]